MQQTLRAGSTKRRNDSVIESIQIFVQDVYKLTDLQQCEQRESLGSLLATRRANCAQRAPHPLLRWALSHHYSSGTLAHLPGKEEQEARVSRVSCEVWLSAKTNWGCKVLTKILPPSVVSFQVLNKQIHLFQRFCHQLQVHKEHLQILLCSHQDSHHPSLPECIISPNYVCNYLESKVKSCGIWYWIILGWHSDYNYCEFYPALGTSLILRMLVVK